MWKLGRKRETEQLLRTRRAGVSGKFTLYCKLLEGIISMDGIELPQ